MNLTGYSTPIKCCLLMWIFYFVSYFLFPGMSSLGILPRNVEGLPGILFAPLIHGNLDHLISNTFPLLILGASLYIFFPDIANQVFYKGYFFTNILVWIFARSFYHIGASGLVYALATFLILYGVFKRNLKSILVSILAMISYGGILYGVFSNNPQISWESHLLGAVVGGVNAFSLSKKRHKHGYTAE